MSGDQHWTNEQRLRALTTEIGGGRPTTQNVERTIELSYLSAEQQRALVEDPFRDEAAAPAPDAGRDGPARRTWSSRPSSIVSSQPQRIRSMLDV
jgi:hypothetical protein